MAGSAKPIPDGYHTITPHLVARDANAAIEFYKRALGAEELCRMPGPDGKKVMHSELKIGDSTIFVCDEFPDHGAVSPQALNGSAVTMHLYVEDADKAYKQAVEAGATGTMEPQDMFWGDRYGSFDDPFGHKWAVATHKEDLTPEDMQQRAAATFGGGCGEGGCGCQ